MYFQIFTKPEVFKKNFVIFGKMKFKAPVLP